MTVLLKLFSLLSLVAATIACGQTTQVCDAGTGICFNQFTNAATRSSVGIVLPPLQDVDADASADPFQQDILVNLTTVFPYGFTGIGRASKDEVRLVPPVVNTFMTYFSLPSSVGTFQTALIGQYSDFSSTNKTHLVPILGASILFSNLSHWDNNSGTFIFRCRNCSFGLTKDDITSDGRAKLNLFRSEVKPVYPEPTALNATLLASNVTIAPFEVHVDDLRSQDYHTYLDSANLLAWFA